MTRAETRKRPGRSSKWIRPEKRIAIYLRDKFRCQYCARDLHDAPARDVGLDHLLCKVNHKSGRLPDGRSLHDESNLITCCTQCNSARGARKTWTSFAGAAAAARIRRTVKRALNMDLARKMMQKRKAA